jgi:phosphopantetheine adenylyltransferase/dephospho-CoA kinase
MTVIGLTGGIASGKSTAAAWLKDFGAVVIDADRLGHRVYEPGTPGFQAVVNEFGHDIVAADGTINRQLLGGKVFGDPTQMKRLTDIVWPEIRRLAREEVTELKRRDKKTHVVLEAAVLVEANWFDLVDEVWVVTVEPEIAKQRLMARNGLTDAQAQARIDSQLSNKERSLHAYVKIDNSGTLEDFQEKVDREWKKLLRRADPGATTAKPAAAAKAAPKTAARTASRATTAPKAAPKAAAPKAAATKSASRTATKAAAAPAKATTAKAPAVRQVTPASKAASRPAARPAAKVAAPRSTMKAQARPPARSAATVRRGAR